MRAESLEAGGDRDWAAEISHAPLRVFLGQISEIAVLWLSSPALPFLGIAMSARKTSLTDKQTKNSTSKYVLERCASINEYYDIAFKVSISRLVVIDSFSFLRWSFWGQR